MEASVVYHFDTLPAHPQPEPLESLTSYLIRLAEANHIRTRHRLAALCFSNRYSKSWEAMDHLPKSFDLLPLAAVCSVPALQATTSMHLARKFARSPRSASLSRFLRGCVAKDLRYCPACLKEGRYYSLTWRFLALPGCVQHHCQFLDHCGHCGQAIPFFGSPLRLGVCTSCGKDLATCRSKSLRKVEFGMAQNRFQDLVFLLSAPPDEKDEAANWNLAPRLAYWRQAKAWSQMDVARQLGHSTIAKVRAMEQPKAKHDVGLTFEDYIRYADCLGLTWREIFTTPIPPEALFPTEPADDEQPKERPLRTHEDEVVGQVQKAIQRLAERGERVSQSAISREVSRDPASLLRYSRVGVILDRVTRTEIGRARQSQREEELLSRVQEVARSLGELGKPLSKRAIYMTLGLSSSYLERYPRTNALMTQIAEEAAQKREEEFTDRTVKAIKQLQSRHQRVSLETVRAMIGATRERLKQRPHLMALVKQAAAEYRHEAAKRRQAERQRREEEWIGEVQKAIQSLEILGQPMTQVAISQLVGTTVNTLQQYSRVRAMLKEVVARRRRNRRTWNV
jgi:hypothetical protein